MMPCLAERSLLTATLTDALQQTLQCICLALLGKACSSFYQQPRGRAPGEDRVLRSISKVHHQS